MTRTKNYRIRNICIYCMDLIVKLDIMDVNYALRRRRRNPFILFSSWDSIIQVVLMKVENYGIMTSTSWQHATVFACCHSNGQICRYDQQIESKVLLCRRIAPTRATQRGNQVDICAMGVSCALKINGGIVKSVQTSICVNLAMMEQMRTNSQSLTSLTTPCNSILGMMPSANMFITLCFLVTSNI